MEHNLQKHTSKYFYKQVELNIISKHHPATNGQAERYVSTVKHDLRAMPTTQTTKLIRIWL